MTEETREYLSALMDGELERDACRFLLRRVETNEDLADNWSNFHLARQCLRKESSLLLINPDFVRGVMQRIEIEVAEAAPSPRAASINRLSWLRWAGGGAIAASVAVFALMISRPQEQQITPLVSQSVSSAVTAEEKPVTTPAPVISIQPHSATITPPVMPASATYVKDAQSTPFTNPRAEAYLIRYYEAASAVNRSEFLSPGSPAVILNQPSASPLAASSAQSETSDKK